MAYIILVNTNYLLLFVYIYLGFYQHINHNQPRLVNSMVDIKDSIEIICYKQSPRPIHVPASAGLMASILAKHIAILPRCPPA